MLSEVLPNKIKIVGIMSYLTLTIPYHLFYKIPTLEYCVQLLVNYFDILLKDIQYYHIYFKYTISTELNLL